MRALLVVNQHATRMNPQLADHVTAALRTSLDVDVVTTEYRGHAHDLARGSSGHYDVVIGLGGDGTINELANGLLPLGDDAPALGALPGGNASVFARNIGLPRDTIDATVELLRALDEGRMRKIGVGHLWTPEIERYFLFNAGMGVDASVLARMVSRREKGKAVSDSAYVRMALDEVFRGLDRQRPHLTLTPGDLNVYFALVVNLTPWTYVGNRAIDPRPRASLNDRLTAYAPTRATLPSLLRLARSLMVGADLEAAKDVHTLFDVGHITLTADRPTWVQADGEAVGQVETATLSHVGDALLVVGPGPHI